MLMEERRELIIEELIANGTVHVSELAAKYEVSYETIRKDLAYLEKKGHAIKSHGGAILKQATIENAFQVREKENIDSKRKIARATLDLIPEQSSLIIGTGSSTLELAKLLSDQAGFTIFTDSLPVASVLLHSDNKVFLFGGQLRAKSSSLFGGWTANQIKQISANFCFLGTDGFSNLSGPTSPSSSDAYIDQMILQQSEVRYILADHSKFNRKSLHQICRWSDITALITNKEAHPNDVEKLRKETQVLLC